MICTQCNGNGFLQLSFEAEKSIKQCWVCKSQGEVKDNKHFIQT
jgi:DnaJ-class molecular chaperone